MDPPKLPYRPYISKHERKELSRKKVVINKNCFKYNAHTIIKNLFLTNENVFAAQKKSYHARSPRRVKFAKQLSSSVLWNVRWCEKFPHILAATSGSCVLLFDVFDLSSGPQHSIYASEMVRGICWSNTSRQLVSVTKNGTVQLYDFLDSSSVVASMQLEKVIPAQVRYWKNDNNVVVVGGDNSFLSAFDLRTCKEVLKYKLANAGDVISMDMYPSDKILTSYNNVNEASSIHSIAVWDARMAAKLSDQIYHESWSCPCVRVHPSGTSFLAQTSGNFICRFSASTYKLDRSLKYDQHKVYDFGTQFDISQDGKHILTGNCDGSLLCYDYLSGRLVSSVSRTFDSAIYDVCYNPTISGMAAATDWCGNIMLLE